MKMNFFEGARRVTKLSLIAILSITIYSYWNEGIYYNPIEITLIKDTLQSKSFRIVKNDYLKNDSGCFSHQFAVTTPNNEVVNIKLLIPQEQFHEKFLFAMGTIKVWISEKIMNENKLIVYDWQDGGWPVEFKSIFADLRPGYIADRRILIPVNSKPESEYRLKNLDLPANTQPEAPNFVVECQTYFETTSNMVLQILNEQQQSFKLTSDIIKSIDNSFQKWRDRVKFLGKLLLILIIETISIFIFARLLGWIVRGFFGIPVGMDFRSKSTDQ